MNTCALVGLVIQNIRSLAEKTIYNVIKTLLSSAEINLVNMSQLCDNFTVTVLFFNNVTRPSPDKDFNTY